MFTATQIKAMTKTVEQLEEEKYNKILEVIYDRVLSSAQRGLFATQFYFNIDDPKDKVCEKLKQLGYSIKDEYLTIYISWNNA